LPERGIAPAIDAVIGQSLAKDPARRFGSARAMKQALGQALSAGSGRGTAQATTVMHLAPSQPAPAPPLHYEPEPVPRDEGAGLNSAFKGIIVLLIIGMLGVGVWAGYQLLDTDRFDFDLPSFGGQEQEAPTPTPTQMPEQQEEFVPIEPTD